tara:strand:+ start:266 stop:688 length:423 start_codon:yes stop_codon:yes gene_type:complete
MAVCSICRKSKGILTPWHEDKCMECYTSGRRKSALQPHHEAIEAIMLTTETAPNLNIKSRVGIIMADADCAFDVAMVKNKDALLSNLKSEAHTIGANAVVGVTFNMIETYSASIGIGKVNTFKLIAYGTAVIIETEEGAL